MAEVKAAAANPIILETERLYLSELSPGVYKHLFTFCSDSEISKTLGLRTNEELASEKDKYQKGLTTYFSSFKNFSLIEKQSQQVIGRCGYHTWIPTHRRAEVGYSLLEDSDKRKGFMTEALGPILAFGFEHMNLHRVEALIAPYNLPSYRLLLHYGFTVEGNCRGHYNVNGKQENSVLYALLQPEYEKLKAGWKLKV